MTSASPTLSPDRLNQKLDRLNELKVACAMLADGFSDFDELIERYVREVPQKPKHNSTSDCDDFLKWVEAEIDLTEPQRDIIINQLSLHAVEYVALKQRIAHLRFQSMVQESHPFSKDSARQLSSQVFLNPVHVWATFESHRFVEEETTVPATVLFYVSNQKVCTAILNEYKTKLLRELEQGTPKLRTLIKQTVKAEREQLLESIAELVQLEIITLHD